MARKLSKIARRITYVLLAGAAALAANTSSAQSQAATQSADSPAVVNNPFTAARTQPAKVTPPPAPAAVPAPTAPKPQPPAEPQPKTHRKTGAYQNPFAASSKAPPVDTTLRPGPISRWRHPLVPGADESAVKTALLSTPAPAPAPKPTKPTWDILPPGEDLRYKTSTRGKETDPTFFPRLGSTPNIIHFNPKPLTQPTWLTEYDEVVAPVPTPIRVDAAVFDEPLRPKVEAVQTSAVATAPVVTPAAPPVVAASAKPTVTPVATPTSTPAAALVTAPTATPVAAPVAAPPAAPVATTTPAPVTTTASVPVAPPVVAPAVTPIALPTIEETVQAVPVISPDTTEIISDKADVSPSIVSNCVETPEGWLEQAQHAATDAESPEELSGVVEFCERGLRGNPDEKQSASLRRLSAWAHNRRGEILADADRSDDALGDFQAAISLDPNCSLAIHNRAVTFAQQSNFDAALRDFNRVIELNPGLAVAYRNRAELFAATGRTQDAIADYNQAVESLPDDAHLHRDRAYAYQQIGEFSKATTDFERAIELAPDDPDAITQRGNLAAEQGNYDQALADYQHALTKNPSWAEAHRSLAWLSATCPNPTFQNPYEAIVSAERAAKLAPADDCLVLDTLAAAHASAGHFDKAMELQQKALNTAPPESAGAMKQRLTLYRNGQAFRNISAAARKSAPPESAPPEVNVSEANEMEEPLR